ncbi:MFS transporter [Sinomonas mesophila]|uniref:MFS transporter n=1 Tax=Sinomonas mesophila TaxID=1531955 RepID=UPI0009864F7A|nr:MFS transporter [Sinomonas mesophila]
MPEPEPRREPQARRPAPEGPPPRGPVSGAVADDVERRRIQRRTVTVLSVAQLLSGLGNGATLAIGSLLAVEFGGSQAWAGAVMTVLTLAAAVAALPLSGYAASRGRRRALVAGLAAAAAGSLLIVLSTMASSLGLLLAGSALLGVGMAVNLQSRFAAVDLADPTHRGRDLSLVVWSITVGAVAGPNLIKPGAALGQALGLPETAGPFVISVTGMVIAAVLLAAGLRPDPLLEARRAAAGTAGTPVLEPAGPLPGPVRGAVLSRGLRAIGSSPGAVLAASGIVAAQGVMVSIMSMTPLHLQQLTVGDVAGAGPGHEGHVSTDSFALIGFTISLHIAGMFALSPLMGWLSDRFGRRAMLAVGHGLLLAAVAVVSLGAGNAAAVTVGLVLLGLGWSAAAISGSALLAESVAEANRVEAQGVSDTAMGLAGATGGALSGVVMALVGFPGLAAIAGLLSIAVLLATAVTGAARPAQV